MKRVASRRPDPDESPEAYHQKLIGLVEGDCAITVLQQQSHWLYELGNHLSVEQIDKIHPPYQWSIRQVFEHCADSERVFGYRLLRFAAGDPEILPGFDENLYADSRFGLGVFKRLVEELGVLRHANLLLLRRIVPKAWDRQGTADGATVSVRALAWITAGHLHHHLSIVEQRCGIQVSRRPM